LKFANGVAANQIIFTRGSDNYKMVILIFLKLSIGVIESSTKFKQQ